MGTIMQEDELREKIDDYIYDVLNRQPRPNDYADDAGYDEAASEYADGIVEYFVTFIKQYSKDYADRQKAIIKMADTYTFEDGTVFVRQRNQEGSK